MHFVGIGGYGMSAIAFVLQGQGVQVTGSDVRPSSRTARLEEHGVEIVYGHAVVNQSGADKVVYSTDVPQDNVELQAARARGVSVVHRSEMLAEILAKGRGICVTGTHGKTTTTSMISAVLIDGGLDPSVVVGGELDWMGGNARIGHGPYVVAEADESDGSFLRYHPEIAVLTNADPEHLDHYDGKFENVLQAYRQFLHGCHGLVLTCHDAPLIGPLAQGTTAAHLSYGLGRGSDFRALRLAARKGGGHRFSVQGPDGTLGRLDLPLPGLHNVRNALAAIAIGYHLGVPFASMARTLSRFRNAARRFEVVGEGGGITVVSDYAHHPTEIAAVLEAARELQPKRLVAVFQPQRYARTKLLFGEFPDAFRTADEVVLLDIYAPPGEQPIPGVSSQRLAEDVRRGGKAVTHVAGLAEAFTWLTGHMQPGDLVLVMGAGDIYRLAVDVGKAVSPVEGDHRAARVTGAL
ncbi:MAG: UDP-N-acetylmuramate--L-alanine ligase [Thermaerobacter sp.]|nr:UDP-N-acetylmuramate--L-alanine ligase [Thermaerobacter sp.]